MGRYVWPEWARYMTVQQAAIEARERRDADLLRSCIKMAARSYPINAGMWTRWAAGLSL